MRKLLTFLSISLGLSLLFWLLLFVSQHGYALRGGKYTVLLVCIATLISSVCALKQLTRFPLLFTPETVLHTRLLIGLISLFLLLISPPIIFELVMGDFTILYCTNTYTSPSGLNSITLRNFDDLNDSQRFDASFNWLIFTKALEKVNDYHPGMFSCDEGDKRNISVVWSAFETQVNWQATNWSQINRKGTFKFFDLK